MFRLVFRNAGWMVLSDLFNRIFALLLTIAVVRTFTPIEFGELRFALSFVALFSVITDFGLTALTIREVSRNKSEIERFIGKTFSLKIIINLIAIVLIILITNLTIQDESQKTLLYLAGISNFVASLSGSLLNTFVAFNLMRINALAVFLRGATLVSLGYLVIFSGVSIAWVLGVYIIANAVSLVIAIISTTLKITKIHYLSLDWEFSKKLFFDSWPFAVAVAFGVINFSLDTIMLSYLGFSQEVALYGAALTLIMIPLTLRRLFRRSLIPTLSKYVLTSKGKAERITYHFKKLFVLLALPLGVATTVLAPKIMTLLFGNEYVGGVIALQILIWGIVFSFLNLSQHEVLVAANRQRLSMKILVFTGLTNALLNLILIPRFGIIGATVSTSFVFFLSLVLATYFANRIIKTNLLVLLPKPIFAAGIMGLVLVYLIDFHLLLLIFLGFVIYIIIIILLKFFSQNEINFARNFILDFLKIKVV